MPKFDVNVPHSMSKEAALEKLQYFSEKIQEKHGDKIKDYEQSWEGDRCGFAFKTMGLRIDGGLTVSESEVRVEGNLPFAAAMFKGQLIGAMEEQLKKLLR